MNITETMKKGDKNKEGFLDGERISVLEGVPEAVLKKGR